MLFECVCNEVHILSTIPHHRRLLLHINAITSHHFNILAAIYFVEIETRSEASKSTTSTVCRAHTDSQ